MRNRPLCYICLSVFLMISLGVIIGGAKFIKELRPSVLEREIGENQFVKLSGQIYDIEQKEKYQIIYLKNNSIIYQNRSFEESRIILYDEEKQNIKIGNKIEVTGRLSFFEEERNPGNFDQKLHYQKSGIHASLWAEKVVVTGRNENPIRQILYELRRKWNRSLIEIMGEEDGAVLSTMLLAEKSGMDPDTKELYQVNGIAHILAISGLHLSIIGVGLYEIFRRISGSYLAGGVAGSCFLFLYVLMIGLSVSVFRAGIMFLFRVGADLTGRHYDSPTALSVSALVTIIWRPLCLYDGGFWLSYGAILGMILLFPIFEHLRFHGLWVSVSIQLATLPVMLYNFFEIPLYSVIINIIVVPLMTVVIICGLAGSVCCAVFLSEGIFGVYGIGGMPLKICGLIFSVYEKICELCLQFPGSRIVAGQPEIWQIVIYYISLAMIVVLWKKELLKRRISRKLAVILVMLSTVLLFMTDHTGNHVCITVMDVGQGDGIFIRGPEGNTYLIDSGSSDVKEVGKYRIEPFLKSQGEKKIDYVFLSHGDSDHMNGIAEMMERMDIGISIQTIVFPERGVWDESLLELARAAMEKGVNVTEMAAGQVFTEGEMNLTCLAPDFAETNMEKGNAASMVLALNYGEFDMLFTGDIEGEGEEILTEAVKKDYPKRKWEVLKAAHHGSKNSSAESFLKEIRPTYAIISAGRDNSYGHPHQETLERLENVGCEVLSTQECGAITMITDGEKMKTERYLEHECEG